MFKQKYNSKFQELKTVQTFKMQKKTTKFGPTNFFKNKQLWENQQKTIRKKRRQPSKTPFFFIFLSSSFAYIIHNYLHKKLLTTFRCASSTLFKAEILKKNLKTLFHLYSIHILTIWETLRAIQWNHYYFIESSNFKEFYCKTMASNITHHAVITTIVLY